MRFLNMLLLTLFCTFGALAAEEVDATTKCDESYERCLEKCDQNPDGSETCYTSCDTTYDKCLIQAQQ